MIYRPFISALFCCLLYFSAVPAFCQDVELIWLEAEGSETAIYYSKYRDNHWSPKRILAAGTGMKVTPAVASINDKSMAIWVNVNEQAELSFTYATGKYGHWQSPRELHFDFQETTAPTLIVFNQRFYLFFAGNKNDDDDIYMSVFVNNKWTEPVMIHPDNNVPDILPEPQIINGALTVTWQHFDGERYINQTQTALDPGGGANITTNNKRNFQDLKPKKLPGKELQRDTPHILKKKFNIDLPEDFRGIGRVRAYIPNDVEMPALHVNTESD